MKRGEGESPLGLPSPRILILLLLWETRPRRYPPTLTGGYNVQKEGYGDFMNSIKTGICPFCLEEKQLAFFQFGVIKSTMCPFCLKKYLDKAVIPNMQRASQPTNDIMLEVGSDE